MQVFFNAVPRPLLWRRQTGPRFPTVRHLSTNYRIFRTRLLRFSDKRTTL